VQHRSDDDVHDRLSSHTVTGATWANNTVVTISTASADHIFLANGVAFLTTGPGTVSMLTESDLFLRVAREDADAMAKQLLYERHGIDCQR